MLAAAAAAHWKATPRVGEPQPGDATPALSTASMVRPSTSTLIRWMSLSRADELQTSNAMLALSGRGLVLEGCIPRGWPRRATRCSPSV